MLRVDTRGMSCPQPVLMTKKALGESSFGVEVLSDSKAATKNITRYAVDNGYKVEEKEEDDDLLLIIKK